MWLNLFSKYRKSLGISLFLFGGPIMYFFRDGIGLAPDSTAFTAMFQVFCFFFMIPYTLKGFKTLYKPNISAYYYSYWFMALGLIYMFTYTGKYTNIPMTIIYDIFIAVLYYLLLTISFDDVSDYFIGITAFVATLGSLLMLYFVLKNPDFVLGQRAAIAFTGLSKNSEFRNMGNPHIYSKVAIAGFWAGFLLRKSTKIRVRFFAYISIFVAVITLLLNQVMASFLALLIGFVVYGYFNKSVIRSFFKWFFGWQGVVFLFFLLISSLYVYNYTEFGNKLGVYVDFMFSRTEKIANLLLGASKKNVDPSAGGRVEGLGFVFDELMKSLDGQFWYFIFGHGYEAFYVDSPVIQTFYDLGIIGFLLYAVALITFFRGAIKAIKYQESSFTIFIALYFFMTLVYAFTQGQPYGYYAWYYYALYARFLGTDTLVKIIPKLPKPKLPILHS